MLGAAKEQVTAKFPEESDLAPSLRNQNHPFSVGSTSFTGTVYVDVDMNSNAPFINEHQNKTCEIILSISARVLRLRQIDMIDGEVAGRTLSCMARHI